MAAAKHRSTPLNDNLSIIMVNCMTIKLLTIDDDPAMTELITLLLKTHGFDVLSANTGEEGVKITKEESPDVVILDLMMPGMDGWQVCTQIRGFSKVPILVFSALDSPGIVASALDAGADDYLVKPISTGVLIAHLKRLTRRTDMNAGNQFKPIVASLPA
jgi:two-component system response regulator MtrA